MVTLGLEAPRPSPRHAPVIIYLTNFQKICWLSSVEAIFPFVGRVGRWGDWRRFSDNVGGIIWSGRRNWFSLYIRINARHMCEAAPASTQWSCGECG